MIEDLPAVNATLNAIAACLLSAGWWFIRHGRQDAHKRCMVSAFFVSALFLACYLVYHAVAGSKPYPGQGLWRAIYFAVLVPHIVLAAGMLPFIAATFLRAYRGQFDRHRRLARWTLPIWLYVSVTGVLVYLMLYQGIGSPE